MPERLTALEKVALSDMARGGDRGAVKEDGRSRYGRAQERMWSLMFADFIVERRGRRIVRRAFRITCAGRRALEDTTSGS
jgi:hypothetical protein